MTRRLTCTTTFALVLLAGAASAQPQSLQQVRELYAQAAYEDALGLLSKLPETESVTDAARYRAACLLALGRVEDAQKAIVSIVDAHPEYRPDPSDTSPRVVELFKTTRNQRLPDIARRMYTDAKAAMDRKETQAAIDGFETLLEVIDDPDALADTTLSELRLLASGFLELNRAQLAAATTKVPELPAAPTRPAAPPVIVPAVPIRQQLPAWTPPDSLTQRTEYRGSVRVQIGVDGRVVSAVIMEPVHPAYDGLVLVAARSWLYEPARQNGVAVPSERTVQIVLKPR